MFKLIFCWLEFIGSCLVCLGGLKGLIVAFAVIAALKPSVPFHVALKEYDLFASVLLVRTTGKTQKEQINREHPVFG